MRVFLLVVFLLIRISVFSQITIQGKIQNKANENLYGATVSISEHNNNIITNYSISSEKGIYELNIDSNFDSLQICVSYLGYSKIIKQIKNENQIVNFYLKKSSEELKEVYIKASAIDKREDTINYFVSSFIEQKDRSISDVINKLPGIDVLSDGKILYQGKPIQKYYINGLDLLEGKYNLANNNLPADAVGIIQILENHQPIKILESTTFSDKASLNIKLKKKITHTGSGKLGVGIRPLLWDVNLSPMFFTKKQQMISTYQTNNFGNDISNDLKLLTLEDFLDQMENNDNKSDWLSIASLSSPIIADKYWLKNNGHILSSNYLIRLKSDFDLKFNISYLNDKQKQEGSSQTSIYTPSDTINLSENMHNNFNYNYLNTKLSLIKNTKKNYIKDDFKINSYWDSQNGSVTANNETISQTLNNPFSSVSNKLKCIKVIGKHLTTIKSDLSYTKTPQNLSITPGIYDSLFNSGNFYNQLSQHVNLENLYTNNFLSLMFNIKKTTLTTKIGFSFLNQSLKSNVTSNENVILDSISEKFKNKLRFQEKSIYISLKSQINLNNFKIIISAPIKLRSFNILDNILNSNKDLTRFTFEPNLFITKNINSFWKLNLRAGLENSYGTIGQLYSQYIITNYRNIQNFNATINEKVFINTQINFSYRNPLKSIFFNSSYSYTYTINDLLFASQINNDGSQIIESIENKNSGRIQNINARGSKIFNKISTSLSIGTNIQFLKNQQIINNLLTDINTSNIQLTGKIDNKLLDWLSISYESKIINFSTSLNNAFVHKTKRQEHSLEFNIYPNKSHYINLNTEFYYNTCSTQNGTIYFVNLQYRYTLKHRKIDLELYLNNILNTNTFTRVYSNSFSYIQSTYDLRPRQVLVSCKFRF